MATEVFLEEGFASASMSTIAARLGGSKGTLYNYFKSKDDLFAAYVERRCVWQQDEVFAVKPGETPDEAVHRIARSFLAFVVDETTVRNFRVVVGEAERSPEIGAIFYNAGPVRGTARLAAFLAELEADGALDLEGDALGAAQHLLGLVQAPTFKGRLCNAIADLSEADLDREASRGVRAFLRAYRRR
ncbi:TetR/AcrR family transcriptional regulator [Phenylobacterium sp.]|uniref:TetR/AcrR family transcriptional regulator n=1 Tax=Phenylobacterium sp. TaxID=1871053 RepID=UPI002B895513|nr:TetR/AcrR family transcriptional regulator [Phenylobacterium sp.]HLZ73698.1 TetR/AcrR family transcriptional regulator [Phenylobacterium sp.]